MATEHPMGHCQECGQEISKNLKHLLRICPDCSKLNFTQKLTLTMSNRKAKGWA